LSFFVALGEEATMSRDTRSRRNYWVLVVVVFAVLGYGAYAVSTSQDCAVGLQKTWQWMPPKWECKLPTPAEPSVLHRVLVHR
jgi:hypothetical protein